MSVQAVRDHLQSKANELFKTALGYEDMRLFHSASRVLTGAANLESAAKCNDPICKKLEFEMEEARKKAQEAKDKLIFEADREAVLNSKLSRAYIHSDWGRASILDDRRSRSHSRARKLSREYREAEVKWLQASKRFFDYGRGEI